METLPITQQDTQYLPNPRNTTEVQKYVVI
jgi:hypothetical protein